MVVATTVAKELIKLLAWVGIPEGFMSTLLEELCHLMQI